MATIKDIAKVAGVSPAAVSRILNQDTSLIVAPETRQKVFDAATALHYTKKMRASTKPLFTIGIVQWFSSAQEIEDSYYLLIRQGIEDFCRKNRISVVRTFKTDLNYLESLKGVDGLICIGKFGEQEIAMFREITTNVIFLDMPVKDVHTTSISLDFKQAVYIAMDYLLELGHRRIGFLTGKEYVENKYLYPDKRKEVFIKYCEKHHIEYLPYLYEGKFTSESGYEMMTELIKKKKLPTAIFAASDPIAIGAMRAITEQGIFVPKDISVVGFDNTSVSGYTVPPLTTIHAPAYEMGMLGAGILFHLFSGGIKTAMKISLPCNLIVRESCGKP